MITDHSGRSLAVSVPVKAIWADPKEVHNAGGISVGDRWKALANALNIPLGQLSACINANPKGHPIYLARQVNPNMVDHIKKLKLPGIHLCEESCRYYPFDEVTAHLIGFANVDSQGIEGTEKGFDKWLTGQPGKHIVRKDRYGRVIEDISSIDSQAAHDLTPSTDGRLQTLVYCELNNTVAFNKAESGNAVLVDVSTGGMLVMVNSPLYNPNNLSGTPKEAMRNRTITDMFEPGPTVKPMVAIIVLQRGMVRENSVLNTIPHRINDHEIKDMARYSESTLTGALQKPDNVGVSRLALAMPSSTLVDAYPRLGLGKTTSLRLVRERSGLYP